ncbi:hypothetical protein H8E88_30685 [candidate division KSB1 bacterium]|nr:hypothetical protein [candidate division KSB1 bacterium]MBL7095556.1 hypothetical protein [candidate division KSB1 bacterium]
MEHIKEEVISLLKKMPDNSSYDDIMEQIYVRQKIKKGQQQLSNEQYYTHEEAKGILEEWLK